MSMLLGTYIFCRRTNHTFKLLLIKPTLSSFWLHVWKHKVKSQIAMRLHDGKVIDKLVSETSGTGAKTLYPCMGCGMVSYPQKEKLLQLICF